MKKQTIHFVYSTPSSLIDRMTQLLLNKKIWHPPWNGYRWPNPVCAPQSITLQIAKRLSADYNVKIYDCRERLRIAADKGDILLGHVWDDPDTIVWKALADESFAIVFPCVAMFCAVFVPRVLSELVAV